MKNDIAISIKNLNKTYSIKGTQKLSIKNHITTLFNNKKNKRIKALTNINLEIKKGEIFGIIGKNGSGKSTLLNIIMESIVADSNSEVISTGKLMRLSLGMGVDPNLSARDNIYVNGSVIGLSFKKIGEIFNDILNFSDLHGFVDTPVKFYSKGMRQRLLFSIAVHAEADIFLLDEFFGGTGDQEFKAKSEEAFNKHILEGRTIVIVSHSLKIIRKLCNRSIWLHKGEIRCQGDTKTVIKEYKDWAKQLILTNKNK